MSEKCSPTRLLIIYSLDCPLFSQHQGQVSFSPDFGTLCYYRSIYGNAVMPRSVAYSVSVQIIWRNSTVWEQSRSGYWGRVLRGTSDLQLVRENWFINYMFLLFLPQTGPSPSQSHLPNGLGIQPFWGISYYSLCVLVIWRIFGKRERFKIDLKAHVITLKYIPQPWFSGRTTSNFLDSFYSCRGSGSLSEEWKYLYNLLDNLFCGR